MASLSDTVCGLCVSTDRNLSRVADLTWIYHSLINVQAPSPELRLCWECRAMIVKFHRFKRQALRAARILEASIDGVSEPLPSRGLSSLCASTKTSYDADFTCEEDLKDILLKQEPDYVSDIEVWADPAVPEYEIKLESSEVKLETVSPMKLKRGRPLKQTSADKFEAFTATSSDLFAYRQRALANLQVYTYRCDSCVVGFTTQDKMTRHNDKYHTESAGEHACNVCGCRFSSERRLIQHCARHATMYRCRHELCDFVHPSSANVKGHYSVHAPKKDAGPERRYACETCAKVFRTAQGLAVHRQTHTSSAVYECHHCGKVFNTRTQIHLHLPHHTLKVMCDVCGKRLPNQRRLKLHALAHLDPSHRPHECLQCHKRFIDKYKLLVHSRQHTGEKPFKCESCTTEYVSKEQLTQHTKKHHSDGGTEKRVYKPRTKSLFRNERIFPGKQQKRQQTKQESEKTNCGKYECNICGKKLSTYQNLQSHFGVHSNERPIKCDECDRTFKYKPQLYAHKLRHTGDKPHQCNICGARFAFKTILNTHLKSHSNEKPYKCDECDLSFKYNSGLWTHKLIHRGEKPHQCNICGARFTLKGNLTGHMKTHTNDKPFECTVCGKKFPWRRNLKNHHKTHAKEQRVIELQ